MWAKSTLTSDTGSIEISASDDTIDLDADVTAAVDLILNNDTDAADGITLKAGRDVDIAPLKLLTAEGDLTIEATTGEIKEDPFIDMDADSKTLTLIQNDSLNLTTNFNIYNRDNTDLVANSTGGSVNSTEADQWQSITATAFETIDLSDTDSGDDIHVRDLTADTGDILVRSKDKVYIDGLLDAGRDVKIAAADESPDSILIDSDGLSSTTEIRAGQDIWLGNNTSIDDSAIFDAGQDIRVGYDENLGIYQPKTLTATNALQLKAGRNITLGGPVTVLAGPPSFNDYLILKAYTGNVHAMGTLDNYHGDIQISTFGSAGIIDLDDNVTAFEDILLRGNTTVAADKKLDAGQDVTLTVFKTMTGEGALTIEADRHITLGGDVEAAGKLTLRADADLSGGPLGGNMWAKGTLTTTAGDIDIYASDSTINLDDDVYAAEDLLLNNNTEVAAGKTLEAGEDVVLADTKTLEGQGALNVEAGDNITFGGPVTAAGTLTVLADKNLDNVGDMWAKSTLTTTSGNIEISASDTTIDLDDDVYAAADLLLNNNTEVAAGKTLEAGEDVVLADAKTLTGEGALDVEAGDHITFGGPVTAAGTLTVLADKNLDNTGDVWAKSSITTTAASDMSITGQNITVDGVADSGGNMDMTAADNITLNDAAIAADSMTLTGDDDGDGVGDVWAKSSLTTTNGDMDVYGENIQVDGVADSGGNMDMTAADNITLNDAAIAADSMTLTADDDGDGVGDVWAKSSLTTTNGDMDVYGENIQVGGVADSGGNMDMTAADNITLNDAAIATESMTLTADDDDDTVGDMWAMSTLTTTNGNIEISASDTTIKLDDDVTAGDNLILNNNTEVAAAKTLHANNDVALAAGKTITGSGNLTITAGHDIGLGVYNTDMSDPHSGSGGEVTAAGNLTISADTTSGGSNIFAHGKLHSDGDMLVEAGDDVYLKATPDSAYAGGNMTLTASAAAGNDTGNLEVEGNLEAVGDMVLSSSNNTTHLYGDYNVAGGSITLNNNTQAAGNIIAGEDVTAHGDLLLDRPLWKDNTDQTVQATNGTLTAEGWVRKVTPGHLWLLGGDEELAVDLQHESDGPWDPAASTCEGNLWIEGEGNVQVSGDLTTFGDCWECEKDNGFYRDYDRGGVAVISNEGKIYTAGGANDTLNVTVEGNSDHKAGLGVDLPYGDGKAAIMIISKEDLKIGPDAELHASGTYYDDVDDRAGMNLLDEPATIGGVPRDEGDPFDVAIYVASTEGNVDVSSPVSIESSVGFPVPKRSIEPEVERKGAMVIDAFDTVTFGPAFEESLAGDGVTSDVGDRLEVVSRISEWSYRITPMFSAAPGRAILLLPATRIMTGHGSLRVRRSRRRFTPKPVKIRNHRNLLKAVVLL